MRLTKLIIAGYRRFEGPAELRILGPVTAVVGPNESGKTTLLDAVQHLSLNASFERREFHGRKEPTENPEVVCAHFVADDADLARAGIDDLFPSGVDVHCELFKRAKDARPRLRLVSPALSRDLAPRQELAQALEGPDVSELLTIRTPVGDGSDDEEVDSGLAIDAVKMVDTLREADENLSSDELEALNAFASGVAGRSAENSDPHLLELAERLADVLSQEREAHPRARAQQALFSVVPAFLFFAGDERQIEDTYAWEDYDDATPALANILHLAEVSFADYRSIATDVDRADELATLERQINARLQTKLSVWTQSALTVTLRADAQFLRVFALEPVVGRDTPLSERSAGLRTFIALIAFATRYGGSARPVLLFDEAEQHLHYGAQADLLAVFQDQEMLANIIYTTHSIGCLPDDLGTTIRVVRRDGASERSAIENNFWATGVGITPLMLAMGASALAFTPARSALIGEGPTEAVLLPSLLRAASQDDGKGAAMGIQIAPGLAVAGEAFARQLETDAGVVLYLVDDDEGGRTHAEKIDGAAHAEGRVFVLGNGNYPGLCTEDLVDGELLVDAFNRVLEETRSTEDRLSVMDLPAVGRGSYLDQWCRDRELEPISKPHVAHVALWLHLDAGGRPLLNNEYLDAVVALRDSIEQRLPG